eukprot:scaffold193803_cov32-Tisochrysis_lutea.AAC.5
MDAVPTGQSRVPETINCLHAHACDIARCETVAWTIQNSEKTARGMGRGLRSECHKRSTGAQGSWKGGCNGPHLQAGECTSAGQTRTLKVYRASKVPSPKEITDTFISPTLGPESTGASPASPAPSAWFQSFWATFVPMTTPSSLGASSSSKAAIPSRVMVGISRVEGEGDGSRLGVLPADEASSIPSAILPPRYKTAFGGADGSLAFPKLSLVVTSNVPGQPACTWSVPVLITVLCSATADAAITNG